MTDARIFVGVLRLTLTVPGASNRKQRRQVVRSVQDRVRHRFDVSVHEFGDDPRPTNALVVMTTAGNDQRVVRSVLERVRAFVEGHGRCWIARSDLDVFRWHPTEGEWGGSFPIWEDDDG